MARKKAKWITIRSKDGQPFKGRGAEVKRLDILIAMRRAARKGK